MGIKEDRDSMFKKETEERKKREEQKKNKGSYNPREYQNVKYVGLEANKYAVVRLIGEPLSCRSLPTSMKSILYTQKALDDNGRTVKLNWANDRNWILWKLYNKVMAYKWEEDKRNYFNREKFPTLFNRLYKNNHMENPLEKGFYPEKYLVLNVIDRLDMQWHKENKHTKLLSKKIGISNEIEFPAPGIPLSVWDMIVSEVVELKGDFEFFDVFFLKTETKPFYNVYHPTMSKEYLEVKAKDVFKYGQVSELTPEERSWEMYDLDKLFQVTSYQKIRTRLGNLFKEVDLAFKTTFYDELNKLADREKEEFAKVYAETGHDMNDDKEEEKEKTQTQEQEKSVANSVSVNNSVSADNNMTKRIRESKKPEIKEETYPPMDFDELFELGFKGAKLLTDEEKKLIKYMNADGQLIYDVPPENIIGCNGDGDTCGYDSPETFHVCPKCGKLFS